MRRRDFIKGIAGHLVPAGATVPLHRIRSAKRIDYKSHLVLDYDLHP
jgi:hypothetical protein